MLNILITIFTIFTFSTEKQNFGIDAKMSSVKWTATKVIGGGHDGTIKIQESTLVFEGNDLIEGSVVINMNSINCTDLTGGMKSKLEGHLNSTDFFDVENHPKATLKILKVRKLDSEKSEITSEIMIKNMTHQVVFEVAIGGDENHKTVSGQVVLNRTKFDIRYGSNSFFDNLGDKAISDEFTLDLDLHLTAK